MKSKVHRYIRTGIKGMIGIFSVFPFTDAYGQWGYTIGQKEIPSVIIHSDTSRDESLPGTIPGYIFVIRIYRLSVNVFVESSGRSGMNYCLILKNRPYNSLRRCWVGEGISNIGISGVIWRL